jgi:hypothetical protein
MDALYRTIQIDLKDVEISVIRTNERVDTILSSEEH